jgi:hypothetical protein
MRTEERLLDPQPRVVYPRLIEASGRCPPEDIGAAPGATPSSSMRSTTNLPFAPLAPFGRPNI